MRKLKHRTTCAVTGYLTWRLYCNGTMMVGDWNIFLEFKDAEQYLLSNYKPDKNSTYEIVESSPRLAYVYN